MCMWENKSHRQRPWQDARGRVRPTFPRANGSRAIEIVQEGGGQQTVPGKGWGQTCFLLGKPQAAAATAIDGSEQMREGGGEAYTRDR